MNIVVCIKQVPDTAEVKINPETNTLIRDGVEGYRRFDGTAAGDGYFERGHCDGR